jgi:hypothetical protein
MSDSSRDASPTRKVKFDDLPATDDTVYMAGKIYQQYINCLSAWEHIICAQGRSLPETLADDELRRKDIYRILKKERGMFQRYMFIQSGYMGEGNYVYINANQSENTIRITHGVKTQLGDSKPRIIVLDEEHSEDYVNCYRLFGYDRKSVRERCISLRDQKANKKQTT